MLAAALGLALPAAHGADGELSRSLTLELMNSKGGQPAPNTPYRLFVTGKGDTILDTPSGDGILHGVTDAEGRTAQARTTLPHAAEDFTLIRRIGDGPWGHFFQLNSSGNNKPLPAWPYIMTMRQRWGEQWVDLGYTNRQGATAYFSHNVPAGSLSLSVDSPLTYDRPCFDELDAINRKYAQDDTQGAGQLIAAMRCAETPRQRLDLARLLLSAGQPELARHWLMQARQRPFPDWLRPVDADLLEERFEVERLLGMPDLVLADAEQIQARQSRRGGPRKSGERDWANSAAYYLADFPDYLAQAEAQARQSIQRFGPRPYNQATLGWILALRGQSDEGLRLMRAAYRELPRDQEMVADYGLALWRDGQREQALRLWHEAQRECVWGIRLHAAMQEAAYPHPYFQASGSSAVKDYRNRCDGPRTKGKIRQQPWQA
ncbi:tetratricopeptide repeat family protein 13 [Achromobacter arsenitoxydans SY8]|uniref:Tetratricopeptide repeat family protein 13 n=2 Tax=Achromobacter TaxID=222 RepID=H0FCS0_9BURK|nr:tetratricopeptide repeat family protein 13 [Achromobacter arsenitoxydans SY8]